MQTMEQLFGKSDGTIVRTNKWEGTTFGSLRRSGTDNTAYRLFPFCPKRITGTAVGVFVGTTLEKQNDGGKTTGSSQSKRKLRTKLAGGMFPFTDVEQTERLCLVTKREKPSSGQQMGGKHMD